MSEENNGSTEFEESVKVVGMIFVSQWFKAILGFESRRPDGF